MNWWSRAFSEPAQGLDSAPGEGPRQPAKAFGQREHDQTHVSESLLQNVVGRRDKGGGCRIEGETGGRRTSEIP